MDIIIFFKDIISPKFCYSCKKEGTFLCEDCFLKLNNHFPYCYICKKYSKNYKIHENCKNDKIYFNKIIVLTHYKNKIIKKLILDSKFYSKKDILYDLAFYLKDILYINLDENKEDCLIVPIPISLSRYLKRGYNQSYILASNLAKISEISISNKIIKKIKNTRQQSKLIKQERELNLKDSFKINKNIMDKVDKKIFIIVDDVVSTGSTINEISRILKQNGAQKVIGLCIASD